MKGARRFRRRHWGSLPFVFVWYLPEEEFARGLCYDGVLQESVHRACQNMAPTRYLQAQVLLDSPEPCLGTGFLRAESSLPSAALHTLPGTKDQTPHLKPSSTPQNLKPLTPVMKTALSASGHLARAAMSSASTGVAAQPLQGTKSALGFRFVGREGLGALFGITHGLGPLQE